MPIKQVLIYRKDLNMRTGKIAAQCCHGSMKIFFDMMEWTGDDNKEEATINLSLLDKRSRDISSWIDSGSKKVVLYCKDEEALLDIYERAKLLGIPSAIITDLGKTEFHGKPTKTVVAIGPADSKDIDEITGPDGAVFCKLA